MPTTKEAQRFREKIAVRDSGCWEFTGACDRNGHGAVWFDGKTLGAHRVAWFMVHGEWPNRHLLHSCDNRACVNVAHLREGSQAENIADMVAKGRQCRGESKPNVKLSAEAVRQIRERAASGDRQSSLAREFGVHRTTIRDAVSGRRWKAVI